MLLDESQPSLSITVQEDKQWIRCLPDAGIPSGRSPFVLLAKEPKGALKMKRLKHLCRTIG
jgi:hypothetical protein